MHRKVTSVDPEPKIVSPVVVKDTLSASCPTNITLTSSTDKSYTKVIIRMTVNNSNTPTDGRLLRMTTSSVYPSTVPIGCAVRSGISIVNAG